jgi:hypothetical protein
MSLVDECLVTADAPTATGTTTIDSTILDMAGFTGVMWVVRIGSAAANNDIRAQQDVVVGMGAAADLAGTKVVSGANTTLVLDLQRPLEQFVRCRVTRGTTTTIDSLVAIRYGARKRASTFPSTQTMEAWVAPAEGTA